MGDSQNFVPNKAPVLQQVTAELWTGGDAYSALSEVEKNSLVSNMTFRLTIDAVDPENEGIRYRYSSRYGTFTPQDVTAKGTTAYFVTSENLHAGDAITVTITATDPVGDSSEYSLALGTVKPVPVLRASLSSSSVVTVGTFAFSGRSMNLYLSADCDGQYQMRIFTASSSASPGMDYSSFVWDYKKGNPVQIAISSSSEKCKITAAGSYCVWVIFADALGQEAAECMTVTATN